MVALLLKGPAAYLRAASQGWTATGTRLEISPFAASICLGSRAVKRWIVRATSPVHPSDGCAPRSARRCRRGSIQ